LARAHIAFLGTGLLGSALVESMLGRGPAVAEKMDEAIANGHGTDDLGALAASSLPSAG